MKIAFFVQSNPIGGGYHQTINFINYINKIKFKNHNIVVIIENNFYIEALKKNNIEYLLFKKNYLTEFVLKIFNLDFVKKVSKKIKLYNPFKKFLINKKIDLIIFNSPSNYILYCEDFNYIANIWNTELRRFNNFPEFLNGGFDYQEKIIESITKYAFKILVFSNANKDDLVKYYNCFSDKIVIQNLIPYLPSLYESKKNLINYNHLFDALNLDKKKKWIFYPAQFWPHKNHAYIIEAVNFLIKKKNLEINFLFTGNDQGNLKYIKFLINQNNLENRIKVLNYLDDHQIISIYLNCFSVCMPTYVGRSSLPLLESFYFKKNIFYSQNVLDEMFKKYVIQCDLNNPEDLANKIIDFDKGKKSFDQEEAYQEHCSEIKLINNYYKLINEYDYFLKRWASKNNITQN
jgi:glycosyltransferase involved in cell wall biosynthesis